MRKSKLADVAREAGVSQGTASNVFNRPEVVRPELRARVLEAAARIGYGGPDPRGRMLRAGRVAAIGVVFLDELAYVFDDPYMRIFMGGVAEVCDRQGAGLSLISTLDREGAAWTIETALVDGFIVECLGIEDPLIALARQRDLPFVAVSSAPSEAFSTVRVDDAGGARLAAEHLLTLGHRHFAVLALDLQHDRRTGLADRARWRAPSFTTVRERMRGYTRALAAHGVPLDDLPVAETANDAPSVAAGIEALLAAAPETTALLAMSDVIALHAMTALRARGLRVPQDLSLIGFDGLPEAAAADPPLTTMAQPIRAKGVQAATLLFAPERRENLLLPVRFRAGGTTAPPPSRR